LNVTRLGVGPAAALRAAARTSLGSASSDILMARASCHLGMMFFRELGFPFGIMRRQHDRANSGPPQEGRNA
jgi:hypothetical protein